MKTEVELKAHIKNKNAAKNLAQKLNAIAKFDAKCKKIDSYFSSKNGLTIRLREKIIFADEKKIASKEFFFTYKKKEIQKNKNGATFEVNKESECKIFSPKVLQDFLLDADFKLKLRKIKKIRAWNFKKIFCELCEVPPLGFFLELETILAENAKPSEIENAQKNLLSLLEKLQIEKNQIESRRYDEMILEAKNSA